VIIGAAQVRVCAELFSPPQVLRNTKISYQNGIGPNYPTNSRDKSREYSQSNCIVAQLSLHNTLHIHTYIQLPHTRHIHQIMGVLTSRFLPKYVFRPPRRASYHPNDGRGYVRLRTAKNHSIVGLHIDRGHPVTVLFSHGNAEDLGDGAEYFEQTFCDKMKVNVFLYEYSGYGNSTGIPSETNVYADVEAAFLYLTRIVKVPPERIILYGRSLGSAPSVHLATKYAVDFCGMILQCPIASVMRVAVNTAVTLPGDMFANIDRMYAVRCPTLIVHGMQDRVVPVHHGVELAKEARCPLSVCWIEHGGHNDLEELHSERLYEAMSTFISDISESLIVPKKQQDSKKTQHSQQKQHDTARAVHDDSKQQTQHVVLSDHAPEEELDLLNLDGPHPQAVHGQQHGVWRSAAPIPVHDPHQSPASTAPTVTTRTTTTTTTIVVKTSVAQPVPDHIAAAAGVTTT
jgi:pimeloyl-ACP methyl ester carboxylesterase